jgi:superfamily II DNA or RNA helicase
MEITEKWLGEIGGWQVMKAARGLADAGMASVSSAEDGLIRGVAGGGKMKFTTGLKIRSRSDVENLCTCPHARRSGQMCEHALAVALMQARAKAVPTHPSGKSATGTAATNTSNRPAEQSKGTTAAPIPLLATVPGRFWIYLPEAILQGQAREPFGVFVKFEPGGDGETSAFAGWLAAQGIKQPQSLPLSLRGEALAAFLATLADHPRVFAGKPNGKEARLQVAAEPVRLPLVVESAPGSLVRLRAGGGSHKPVWGAWWLCTETQVLFRQPSEQPELTVLALELGSKQVSKPLHWLVEHGERLAECFQLELRGEGLQRFHVSPVPCEFEIHLDGSLQQLEMRVWASYGKCRWSVGLEPLKTSTFPIQDENCEFIFYVQNRNEESAFLRSLELIGFQFVTIEALQIKREDNILKFYSSDLNRLRQRCKVVESERWRNALRGVQRIAPQTRFVREAVSTGGGDWLSMEFAYESADGFRLPRAEVLRLVRSGQRSIQSRGKRYILDLEAVDELEESLRDVPLQLTPEGARVHGAHAAYFEGTEDAKGQKPVTSDEIQVQIGELGKLLRPYQMEGVCWMTSQVLRGRGGVLADEMGLGKTVQSIALALFLKHQKADGGPVLVVCPKSLLGNWQAEFERFAPHLKVLLVQGSGREKALEMIPVNDVILTSYQLVVRDIEYYQKIQFGLILLDEASFIRNPDTDAAKTLRSLKADGRVALTGTPLENGVRDLWSIFQFALPGYLGNQKSFQERFERPIQGGLDLPAGRAAALRLQKLTQPYFLRRTKRQVLKDLPEKIEQVLWCVPSAAQAEFYRKILEEGREEINAARRRSGQNGAKMTMFTVLLRLRQVCCDLRLTGIRPETLAGLGTDDLSGKWPALLDQVGTALESGGKVLVFSQFVQFLRLMRERFQEQKHELAYLDGSSQDRSAQVERFQKDPNCRIFLISLKAGGYGLNLTAAGSVILADPWWNPAVEAQAIDRAHRIGQQKVVNAYRLVTRGTVEERILKLQAQKRGLVEATLNDQAPMMEGLSEADLESLIE